MKTAVVVLPTYNEKGNVGSLIEKIFSVAEKINDWKLLILVVDDNSPDQTFEVVKTLQKKFPNLHLISGKKEGLGKAYIRGFGYSLEHLKPDAIFEMDADWSHDPQIIPQFLARIDDGARFVIGARYIKGGSIPKEWAWYRKVFSFCGNLVVRLGFMTLNIHDWTNGYRAIDAAFIKKVLPKMSNYNGYVFQIALLDKAKKAGLQIDEVPLHFEERKSGKSKINSLQYISDIIRYIFGHSPFIKYSIVGVTGAIIDFGISYILIEKFGVSIWKSTLVSAEIAIVSNFFLNNFWSFSHKKVHEQRLLKSFIHFNFISTGSLIIQTVLLHFATELFPRKFWYLYKAVVIGFVIIPYSYYLYNKVIWKHSPKELDF